MNKATFKTIGEVLVSPKIVIPNYQRGYKWAVKYQNGNVSELSAVEKLLCDIKLYVEKGSDYFLQGITVQEQKDKIILIDGQQRITTLYLLLWCAGGAKAICDINLKYDIRKISEEFLCELKNCGTEEFVPTDEDEQDVYYFKKAICQMKTFFRDNKGIREKMETFIRQHVKVIYIAIDTMEKAVRTFTMMNGAKANMLDEELAKAEMLRLVSCPLPKDFAVTTSLEGGLELLRDICAEDMNTISLRNKYAREWDKWLYWWNREDVRDYFNVNTPMGLLLDYMSKKNDNDEKNRFEYDAFTRDFLHDTDSTISNKKTKHTFKELRHLQKSFEDIYDDPVIYNWLGLSLKCSNYNEKFEIIRYFMEHKNDKLLKQYAQGKMIGATHKEMTEEDAESIAKINSKRRIFIDSVLNSNAYNDSYDSCCKILLYLNVVEENKLNKLQKEKKLNELQEEKKLQGRKFDFSIWQNKSLEHIFPKSKVYHKNEEGIFYRGDGEKCTDAETEAIQKGDSTWLNREDIEKQTENKITEHSIGNLVLLYKNNNSAFSNNTFEEKKKIFFNINDSGFKSRNLLHSISKFAVSKWDVSEIARYYEEVRKQLNEIYANE